MAAPVKNTCPDIDRAIRSVQAALKIAHSGMSRHEKRSDDWTDFDDIDTELRNLEGELEDLRNANASLREWGEQLTDELETSANYINELEQKLETLKLNQ